MPVACPPLIPTGGVVSYPGLNGFEGPSLSDKSGDFYLLTFNNGDNPGYIHWIVGAGLDHAVQSDLFDPRLWDVPGRARRLGERRYGPWMITFFRFPPHPQAAALGGRDLALAKVGHTTYFATLPHPITTRTPPCSSPSCSPQASGSKRGPPLILAAARWMGRAGFEPAALGLKVPCSTS